MNEHPKISPDFQGEPAILMNIYSSHECETFKGITVGAQKLVREARFDVSDMVFHGTELSL